MLKRDAFILSLRTSFAHPRFQNVLIFIMLFVRLRVLRTRDHRGGLP